MTGEKKILYILAEVSDFWSSRLPLALAVQDKGYTVYVAAPGASLDDKMTSYGFQGIDLPPAPRGFSLAAVVKTLLTIRSILKRETPNIAHIFTLKYSFFAGLAALGLRNSKIIFTIAGLGYLFSGEGTKSKILLFLITPFLKFSLRGRRKFLIFQNPDDMRVMIDNNFVLPEVSTLIRGSGVDLEKFSPNNNTQEQPPLVLMPTRLVRDKGLSVFIEMAQILTARGVEAQFQIAGGVTDHNPLAISKDEMERMVAHTPVEWIGKVPDMPALYARASLIVYPSWYGEGIPRVLLEAAAMGKPCVTTDHPGCREAVSHNDNGLLVPVKNAQATAEAVEKLLKNPSLREAMGKRGRQKAETEFDVHLIVRETLALYKL